MADAFDIFLDRLKEIHPTITATRDYIDRFAYGGDASFYRLVPEVVVTPETIEEVQAILNCAANLSLSITFRAAGTSLSGQALSDSILMRLGGGWRQATVLDKGMRIALQPGVSGAEANRYLAQYQRKIGPDPASIDSAKIGGIAANNSSGMCCGTEQNSYQTVDTMKVILADGTFLDTGDPVSRAAFSESHGWLLNTLEALAADVQSDADLKDTITRKFKVKNTIGYALNALIDFDDPFDIFSHLMIGSEGTLGFIAEITYHSVVDHPNRATALVMFGDIKAACDSAAALGGTATSAAELMDTASLHSVAHNPKVSNIIGRIQDEVCALLVEVRTPDSNDLEQACADVAARLQSAGTLGNVDFTRDVKLQSTYWAIRKGLFPAAGANRPRGTTIIIEDVSFPKEKLGEGSKQLRALLTDCGYETASIFGHALAGNVHFIFAQDFSSPEAIAQYKNLMERLSHLVLADFQGALKAEHGTGRNMAPFVEAEWGAKAYALMHRIKAAFDPKGLLNPDVILSDDPSIHLKNLKTTAATNDLVDACIECGFCEPSCPSRDLTLSPRQRIATSREIARLKALEILNRNDQIHLSALQEAYSYHGDETCAACGMCAIACPVDINTGDLTRLNRADNTAGSSRKQAVARYVSKHFEAVMNGARLGLAGANMTARLVGDRNMATIARLGRRNSRALLPQWSHAMPAAAPSYRRWRGQIDALPKGVKEFVYFSACGNRVFGPQRNAATEQEPIQMVLAELAGLAEISFKVPRETPSLCCGMTFESKGHNEEAMRMAADFNRAMLAASHEGALRIVTDMSPCVQHIQTELDPRLTLYDPVRFVAEELLDRLDLCPVDETIALHLPCSVSKLGDVEMLKRITRACARHVIVLDEIPCCGFAGDKGFYTPELNASALNHLNDVDFSEIRYGVSTSRTCEIGLAEKTGFSWHSLFDLVRRAARHTD